MAWHGMVGDGMAWQNRAWHCRVGAGHVRVG